jgi:hypothetical protein
MDTKEFFHGGDCFSVRVLLGTFDVHLFIPLFIYFGSTESYLQPLPFILYSFDL